MKNIPQWESQTETSELEYPGKPIAVNSRLYIERYPWEERAYQEIAQLGSLIRIKGCRKIGKASFLLRLINHAQTLGYQIVTIDFLEVDTKVFESTDKFLRWFCINLARRLKLTLNLDDYWDEELGYKVSCTLYFEELLEEISTSLVLIFKEVNYIFEHPNIAQDFLPLLRFWHEQAPIKETWKKLRLVVVYATEVYVSLSVNQSPFNLGLAIKLSELTSEQVKDFAQCYELNLPDKQIKKLMNLVGGHPYLIHMALDSLYRENLSFKELLRDAPTQAGIYRDYLRGLWGVLQKKPKIADAFKQLITRSENMELEPVIAYQLESLGLVKLDGNICIPACQLYPLYFQGQKLGDTSYSTLDYRTKYRDYQGSQLSTNLQMIKVSNHDFFNFCMQVEWQTMAVNNSPIGLILSEIDNYQIYKQKYGVEFTNYCLEIIRENIEAILREIINVYFNNENQYFMIILPNADAQTVMKLAEIILQRIQELTLSPDRDILTNFPNSIVTMSIGVAATIPSDKNEPSTLLFAADQALLESRKYGNFITLSSFLNYQS